MTKDWRLIERARQMRLEPTEPEKHLWRHLSNAQLEGFKFRRQATLEPFIIDFFCPSKGLIVEVDGETHLAEEDARRDELLARRVFTTIRFTNDEVRDHMDGVLMAILERLRALPDRGPGKNAGPTHATPGSSPGRTLAASHPPLKRRGLES